jgi:hypothetical protein
MNSPNDKEMNSPHDEELRKVRAELEDWLPPHEFARKVETLDRFTNDERFNSAKLKFLRDDAWVLAQFARLMKADSVRLVRRQTEGDADDGYVKIAGQCLKIQITEADRESRKRGKEYRPNAPTISDEHVNDAEYLARVLTRAIQKKTRYAPPPPTLVVNLNLGLHGNQEQETKLAPLIANIKERYKSNFSGIYVLQNDRLV